MHIINLLLLLLVNICKSTCIMLITIKEMIIENKFKNIL